jgi:hypothetical protein
MATAMIRDGNTIRVEWPIPWYGRLFSLPLLAASLCLFYYVLLALRNHVIGLADASDQIVDLLISCALGLVIGVPGLMVATFRYFAVVDMALRQVTAIRQFGPLKFRRPRNLSDFNFISVTDDGEKRGLVFGVNLCGQKGTTPVTLRGFAKRQAADDFARELGSALKLPLKNFVDTEPDDPDLDPDAPTEAAALLQRGRKSREAFPR